MSTDATASTPEISVVVPFFDSERYIATCVESLQAQSFDAPYEVIFVNNRSTDASASIVAGYSGLTVLEEETQGAYAARNTGIRQAAAPLIAFTDADCVVDVNWLRSIRRAMEDPSLAILVGRCRYPRQASWSLHLLGSYEAAKAEYVINRCGPGHHFAYGNNMAVRASVFEELGLFREWKRAGDTELVHRMESQRPDLRLVYEPAMQITHLEFLSTRARLQRLRLYRDTNSRIADFRELDVKRRLGILGLLLGRRTPAVDGRSPQAKTSYSSVGR